MQSLGRSAGKQVRVRPAATEGARAAHALHTEAWKPHGSPLSQCLVMWVQPSQQATSFCSAFLICVKTLIFKSFKGFSILHSSKLRGKRQKLAKIVIVCSHRLILRRWLTRLYSGPLASASKCSDYRCIHHSGFIFSPFIQQVFLIIFQFMSDAFISWAPPVPEWSREEGHRGRQKMPTSAHAGEE